MGSMGWSVINDRCAAGRTVPGEITLVGAQRRLTQRPRQAGQLVGCRAPRVCQLCQVGVQRLAVLLQQLHKGRRQASHLAREEGVSVAVGGQPSGAAHPAGGWGRAGASTTIAGEGVGKQPRAVLHHSKRRCLQLSAWLAPGGGGAAPTCAHTPPGWGACRTKRGRAGWRCAGHAQPRRWQQGPGSRGDEGGVNGGGWGGQKTRHPLKRRGLS
jgi:hypothetical protein